jgi:hypothetical protein
MKYAKTIKSPQHDQRKVKICLSNTKINSWKIIQIDPHTIKTYQHKPVGGKYNKIP